MSPKTPQEQLTNAQALLLSHLVEHGHEASISSDGKPNWRYADLNCSIVCRACETKLQIHVPSAYILDCEGAYEHCAGPGLKRYNVRR